MEQLPWHIATTFGITVLIAVWLFSKATHYSKPFLVLVSLWIILQSIAGLSGFYFDANKMTSRFPLLIIPALLFLASLFFTSKGKALIDSRTLKH